MAFEPIGTTEILAVALTLLSAVATAVRVTVPVVAGAVKTVVPPLAVWNGTNVPQSPLVLLHVQSTPAPRPDLAQGPDADRA